MKIIRVTGCNDCSKKRFEELYFYWYCGPEDATINPHKRFNINENVKGHTIHEDCPLEDSAKLVKEFDIKYR